MKKLALFVSLALLCMGLTATVSEKTADYSIVPSDNGATIVMNSGSARTIYLPSLLAEAAGFQVTIVKKGAGSVTIQAPLADYIGDSSVHGTIANSVAGQTYATITLELGKAHYWQITGASGTWVTDAATSQFGDVPSVVTKELFVDAGRSDSYTADGSYTKPFKTVLAALAVINADTGKSWTVHVNAGTYSDNLTITGPRFLRIEAMGGVVISGTILINSGVGSYDHIEFVGQETGFSEKGPALTLSGAITCTRTNDSLIYVSFKGCLISGALATATDGTWVLQYDGCRVNGTITGTFSAAGHPQILLITNGWNEFAAAISGKLAFYDCNGSDFYGAVNTTPYYASKFRHCSFSSTVSIVPVSPADSVVQSMDLQSYKSMLARTPTLTGASVSILETYGAGTVAATGNKVVDTNSGSVHTSVFTLTDVDIAPAAAGAGVAFGNVKLYDFPAGHIYMIGTVADLALTDATATGAEMAGNFATWTAPGAPATWDYDVTTAGAWHHATGDATALTTDVAAVAGTTYTVSVTMATSVAGGGLVVAMGGVTQSEVHGTETATFTFTASATTALTLTPASGTWVGDITAVSVTSVSPVSATWDGDIAFGTAADADGSLAGTEVNLVPSTATPQAVASVTTGDCQSTATEIAILDGHTTALDLYLNLLIDAADFVDAGTGALHLNGTVTVTWINLGDN